MSELIKLTVTVPADMRRQAKAAAALRGTALSNVIRDALAKFIEEQDDIAYVDEIEKRIAEGKERIYSHEEVWADIDDAVPA